MSFKIGAGLPCRNAGSTERVAGRMPLLATRSHFEYTCFVDRLDRQTARKSAGEILNDLRSKADFPAPPARRDRRGSSGPRNDARGRQHPVAGRQDRGLDPAHCHRAEGNPVGASPQSPSIPADAVRARPFGPFRRRSADPQQGPQSRTASGADGRGGPKPQSVAAREGNAEERRRPGPRRDRQRAR